MAEVVGIILGLSLTVTKAVDFIRNLPMFKGKYVGSWIWNAVAFVAGIVLCVGWQHSFINDLAHQVPALTTVNFTGNMGYVLSGLLLGGLSGFFHELLDALSSVANNNNTP
jgi:Na+/H+ antiporter NhaD/arsenite permease-like protein